MSFAPWVAHFEANKPRPLPDTARAVDAIPEAWIGPLGRSLAKFQRGETGEGRIANEVRKIGWDAIDPTYVEALKLFIAEEGRHARILGTMCKALDAPPAPDAWTGKVFEAGRRALDPRFELVALCGAEVAAIGGYATIVAHLPDCGVRDGLAQLVADERQHLEFHAELFREACPTGLRRAAFLGSLSSILVAAGGILLSDHAELWKAMGVQRREILGRLRIAGQTAFELTAPVALVTAAA